MWNTYVWVADAGETAARARDAGGVVMMEPFDVMDAGRMALLADPEGAAFCVWQAKQHKGAKVVNEHGSLNFNVLATRDPERAEAFYGDVFGWRTLAVPGGVMWALPGYVARMCAAPEPPLGASARVTAVASTDHRAPDLGPGQPKNWSTSYWLASKMSISTILSPTTR